ncbi:hypothetical protein ACWD6L_07860 [Micromonospora profundi]|uniref:hypothetical protein n=1 Tax=Micromonospora TaxID=1873 RepID=UPI0006AEE686|nr:MULTISPECIES: hypothetical protein [Micromonospora]KOX05533.1 hypothetical protein ADK66_23630 [Micromonospora sp. NRRL B-16802]NJC14997.1 hypothetical protein [Micromonospora profundi]
MSSANQIRPARRVVLRSLRELTRLAFTALVLAVGLGGALAATPPPSPTQPRPIAVSSRVDTLRPEAASAAQTADSASPPNPSEAADGAVTTTATGPVAAGLEHSPAIEPGRGAPARRGPPTR